MSRLLPRLALLALALVVGAAPVHAHEGPPFPVIVDEALDPWSLSVWADPDVGTGTFWVRLQPLEGRPVPEDSHVVIHAAPADGRLPETRWRGEAGAWRDGQEHVVEVEFPTRETWTVRFELRSDALDRQAARTLRLDVTPPGYGPIDLLLYLWPFLALGVLWLRAFSRHRGAARQGADSPSPRGSGAA